MGLQEVLRKLLIFLEFLLDRSLCKSLILLEFLHFTILGCNSIMILWDGKSVPPVGKGRVIMGLSIKDMRDGLAREREVVKNMLADMKAMRASIKASRELQKKLRAELKEERAFRRIVKADNRRIEREQRAQKQAARMHARIAKAEARLQALVLKANAPKNIRKNQRKASEGVVYTAEQIAAFEATRS